MRFIADNAAQREERRAACLDEISSLAFFLFSGLAFFPLLRFQRIATSSEVRTFIDDITTVEKLYFATVAFGCAAALYTLLTISLGFIINKRMTASRIMIVLLGLLDDLMNPLKLSFSFFIAFDVVVTDDTWWIWQVFVFSVILSLLCLISIGFKYSIRLAEQELRTLRWPPAPAVLSGCHTDAAGRTQTVIYRLEKTP